VSQSCVRQRPTSARTLARNGRLVVTAARLTAATAWLLGGAVDQASPAIQFNRTTLQQQFPQLPSAALHTALHAGVRQSKLPGCRLLRQTLEFGEFQRAAVGR
jgi:hypothetical protein